MQRAELPATVWDLVEQGATRHADHVVLADDYGRSLTGAQLRDTALGVAAALHERGIGPGAIVSWQLPTTLETMVVMVALNRLGAVQNPIIPIFREREVGFMTRRLGPEFLLVPETWQGFDHGAMARGLARESGFEVVICDHATDPASTGGALRLPTGDPTRLPPPPSATPDAVRWLYFSSGTTAEPKGARHTDSSVMASAAGIVHQYGAGPDDVNPLAFPISHIGGATTLTASLVTGMRLVLFDTFDPGTTSERIAAHDVTLLGSAQPFFLAFVAAQRRHGDAPLFRKLRGCLGAARRSRSRSTARWRACSA